MSDVIKIMLEHRSIRKFTDELISSEQLHSIIQAGQAASSSSFLQTTSIIRVTDKSKRDVLVKYSGGQGYVASAAEFLVFCIDYQRHHQVSNEVQTDFTELTLIGAIDAGIMAQNVLLAAESLGLGGVYIGGLRNCPNEVHELLGLPQHTAVLFGLCLGHPAQDPQVKPRLPVQVMLHENTYQTPTQSQIEQYDETMKAYYSERSSNQKTATWSDDIAAKLTKESRPFMKDYLNSKDLAVK